MEIIYQPILITCNGLHVPFSVSVASNVPGYEASRCFVIDGDSNKLVEDMMTYLQTISDAAFKALKPSYESELDKLKMLEEVWDNVETEYRNEKKADLDEEGEKNTTNPFKSLLGQLFGWLHQLPDIGFLLGKVRHERN